MNEMGVGGSGGNTFSTQLMNYGNKRNLQTDTLESNGRNILVLNNHEGEVIVTLLILSRYTLHSGIQIRGYW
jgi:hypothetical protein